MSDDTNQVLPVDQWTPEYIDGLETDLAAEQVKRKVTQKFASERKVKGAAMVAAANATPFLLKHYTQKALAESWPMDNGSPRSSSLITAYRRCGIALRKLGVEPKDNEWNLLANKMGANIKIVGDAIEPTREGKDKDGKTIKIPVEPTREGLLEALNIAFTPDGKKRSSKEIDLILNPQGQDDEGVSDDESPTPDTNTLKNMDNQSKVLGGVEMILDGLNSGLSDEEWKTVYPILGKLVSVFDEEAGKRSKTEAAAS